MDSANPEFPGDYFPLMAEAIVADDPSATLAEIVGLLHAHAFDDDFVSMMGVGPIESLLHQGHGEALWPQMEHLVRTDAVFRRALRSAWAYESPEFERRKALLDELAEG